MPNTLNQVNFPINRYFTDQEKVKIMKLHYENNMDYVDIAKELNSLPNNILWCIMRWKYVKEG